MIRVVLLSLFFAFTLADYSSFKHYLARRLAVLDNQEKNIETYVKLLNEHINTLTSAFDAIYKMAGVDILHPVITNEDKIYDNIVSTKDMFDNLTLERDAIADVIAYFKENYTNLFKKPLEEKKKAGTQILQDLKRKLAEVDIDLEEDLDDKEHDISTELTEDLEFLIKDFNEDMLTGILKQKLVIQQIQTSLNETLNTSQDKIDEKLQDISLKLSKMENQLSSVNEVKLYDDPTELNKLTLNIELSLSTTGNDIRVLLEDLNTYINKQNRELLTTLENFILDIDLEISNCTKELTVEVKKLTDNGMTLIKERFQ